MEVAGRPHALPLRGRLFETQSHERKPLAVGDRVQVRLDAGGGAIEARLPRTTELHRRAAGEAERSQVVAANVSLVLAVTSVDQPPFQPELVDGVLVAAAREEIPAAIALTKVDLDPVAGERWAALYRGLGYPVFALSLADGQRTEAALAELGELLHRNRSVVCGLSGVGKSSLLNAVIPGQQLRIGSLSHIQQGRHTTTRTELVPLPGGGHVLDTPGVRSFHLFHVGAQELAFYFPELKQLLAGCGYRNCLHQDEPGCAVRAAVADGTIADSRYRSYRVMLAAALGEDPDAASPAADADADGRRRLRRPHRRHRR